METHTHPAFDPDHPNPQDSPTSPAQPEAEARPAPAMPAGIYPESPATPIAPIQPNMAPAAAAAPEHAHTPAGLIVLEWLTYAFWGWTVLGMSILTATVISSFVNDSDTSDFAPYAIAAVLVLLPISIVTDIIYTKREPLKKTGAAAIVMVIHAVIFALFGIGSLIAAVISVITMFTSTSSSHASEVALFSAIIIFILYGVTFLRTLLPTKFPWIRRAFIIFMVAVVGLIAILGIVGPVAKARSVRTDKLIEQNLPPLSTAISSYATKNHRLPSDLNALDLSNDTKLLVDQNLVDYKQDSAPTTSYNYNPSNYTSYSTTSSSTYYYELCVTYKKASSQQYPDYGGISDDGYDTYPSTYSHKAGNTCYKLKTGAGLY
jgi:hypothetical protein